MLNWIVLGMVTVSVLSAALLGKMHLMTEGILARCEATVMTLMLPTAGMITLWMGVMRLVEKSGLIWHVSRIFRPVLSRIFPDIPADHPALGSIALNLGANMLGAGNAATPLGIRAMQQINSLNPHPGVASNAMCMFLALNTAAITIVPASTLARLGSLGSKNPSGVILPAMFTTVLASIVGVLACFMLQRMRRFRAAPLPVEEVPPAPEKKEEFELVRPAALAAWKKLVLALFVLIPAGGAAWYVAAPASLHSWQGGVKAEVLPQPAAAQPGKPERPDFWQGLQKFTRTINDVVFPPPPASASATDPWPPTASARFVEVFGKGAMPFLFAFFVLYAALSGLKVYGELAEGAKDGMFLTLRVIPYVVGMIAGIGMLRDSGALQIIERMLSPLLGLLQFPVEVLPMAIIRPLSGGAASGVLLDIGQAYGPDDLRTMIAATINGSTETTFYVAAVYFGAVGVKRLRHAIAAGLIADVAAMFAAVWICRLIFG